MLIDSSKINFSMPYTFARLQNIHTLITDQPLPDECQKAPRQARVLLLYYEQHSACSLRKK
jgi:DeoR/GlpR family transcriptional regulator of sugar metabolism